MLTSTLVLRCSAFEDARLEALKNPTSGALTRARSIGALLVSDSSDFGLGLFI
jgi:hypothetical protein